MNAREVVSKAIKRPGHEVHNKELSAIFDGQQLIVSRHGLILASVEVSKDALTEFHVNSRADANAANAVAEACDLVDQYHFTYSGGMGYVTIKQDGELIGVYPAGTLPWSPE